MTDYNMKIAIDITPLQTGHKDRGVGAYTKLLIEALQKYDKKHSYSFFTRGQKVPDNIELIHYPYFDPFFVTLPPFYSKPTVITVHDLIPLVFPKHFPSGVRGTLKWRYQRMRLNKTKRIIADSEASKRDIMRIAGISVSQIDVVHLAPSPQYRKLSDRELLSRVKSKYGLPDAFILFVGDVNWNKNILSLLEAISKYKEIKLVLVGKAFLDESLHEAQEINAFIDENKLDNDIVKLGAVVQEDLVAIYNLASVYVQPSLYEGFGLPVLEAMSCGVPVVTSRAASLAEIAGPAIAVDPSDPQDIARGLLEALTMTPVKRKALIAAQTKWVQQFSWEHVAHQTIESYEKAIS